MDYTFEQSRITVSSDNLALYKERREKLVASLQLRNVETPLREKLEKTVAALRAYEISQATPQQTLLVREAALNILKKQDRAPFGLVLAEKLRNAEPA